MKHQENNARKQDRQKTWQEKTSGKQARGAEQRLREGWKKDERDSLFLTPKCERKKRDWAENKEPASERDRPSEAEREEIAAVSPAGLAVGRRDRLGFPIPSSRQAATQAPLCNPVNMHQIPSHKTHTEFKPHMHSS